MTTEELQRELAGASQVIAALTIKLDRANARIKRLEAAGDETKLQPCMYCMQPSCECGDFDVDPEMGAK